MVSRAFQEIGTPLSEQEISSGLVTKRIGSDIHVLQTVDSTNDEAGSLANSGAVEGTVVIAEQQRHGRGRMGRRWASPRGVGLYLSVILRPPIPPHDAPVSALLAAVAVADAIEHRIDLLVRVKWPNDLIIHERKVGGILGEVAADASRLHHVILGIGINVNQTEADFEDELQQTATSLRIESGRLIDRTAILQSLLQGLDRWYDRFLCEGVAPVIDSVQRRCLTLGRQVVARSHDQQVRGIAVELDATGALMIRDANGQLHRLFAGDVTLVG